MSEKKEFLQSELWLRLQEATGKETVPFFEEGFSANGIIHPLPWVGKYLYIPRGPLIDRQARENGLQKGTRELMALAQEKKMRWIRIEPETEEWLEAIKSATACRIVKAPHDVQPREIFKIDIAQSEEELLSRMKPKTRYNIRLAEKRGVKVFETQEEKYRESFLRLITETAGRKGISAHSQGYYEKFFSVLPTEACRLFVAEYQGVVLAANLIIFYGDTVTYLHGGSSDFSRDTMAPYLLQWKQIQYAKEKGYTKYDFGGIKTASNQHVTINEKRTTKDGSDWEGITRFKMGFSPNTKPVVFPGSYDIVIDTFSYTLYRIMSWLRSISIKLTRL